MSVCVHMYSHLGNCPHMKTINIFTYIHSHAHADAFSLWQFRWQVWAPVMKSICAPGDKISSKLIFFWLNTFIHTSIYQSPSFQQALWACVLCESMCIQFCVFVSGSEWEWLIVYKVSSQELLALSALLTSLCLLSVLPISTLSFHLCAFCCEADKYSRCFFKQWPWYEPQKRMNPPKKCVDGLCILKRRGDIRNIE